MNTSDLRDHDSEPVFIVGCPRSGTTLLQLLIDLNTDYAIPPESFVFQRYGTLLAEPRMLEEGQAESLARLLRHDSRLKRWNLPADLLPRFDGRGPVSSHKVITEFFEAYARFREKSRWGEKTPQHAENLPGILRAFPHAKILHMLRDPRDVVASYTKAVFGPETALLAARRWKHYAVLVEEHTSDLSSEQFRTVKYEDLVTTPEQTVASLLEILAHGGQGIRVSLADSPLGSVYEGISNAHTAVTRQVDPSSVGRWRSRLTPREAQEVEFVTGEIMQRFGYSPEADLAKGGTKPDGQGENARHLTRKLMKRLVTPAAYKHAVIEFGDWASARRFRAWSRRHFPTQ